MLSLSNSPNSNDALLQAADTDTSASTPGAAGLGDSLYPNFGNGGYDAQKYTLDLNVTDVETSALIGDATIDAKATQNLSSFNLDFIGFTIDGITVNGQPATYSRGGQELTITPVKPISSGEAFTVDVKYSGAPEQITSVALPVLTGWVNYDGGSFVLSEPDGAANYYPVNDHPLDKAAYTFRITVPEAYEAVANGTLEQTIDNGDTTTYVYEARDPMASYLTTVDITSGFQRDNSESASGIPIRNYFADEVSADLVEPFKRQSEMLDYFSQLFGPYPFDVYGSVVMNTETGSALETQTLSIFGLDQLGRTPAYTGGFSASTEEVVAHELSHQWFGDSVSLSDWSDIWLNESFATYAQGLWLEHSQGREVLDQWIKNKYNTVVDSLDNLVPPGEPPADDLFNSGVYEWGALGLHALRLKIGDDAFFKTLKTYTERNKNGNVTPDDLINIAEEKSGQELNAFFDSWFYSDTIPDIPELGLSSAPTGDQTLYSTDDTIFGRDGNDTIYGVAGTNILVGGTGDDALYGGSGTNTLLGGEANDTLYGGSDTNTLDGGSGDNLIYGSSGADIIRSGSGNDIIYSGGGADTITSGAGSDTVWLGGDAATVVLGTGDGYDTIYSFLLGTTKLQLGSLEDLQFADTASGVEVQQAQDVIAVVAGQTASTFSQNTDQIFTAA